MTKAAKVVNNNKMIREVLLLSLQSTTFTLRRRKCPRPLPNSPILRIIQVQHLQRI